MSEVMKQVSAVEYFGASQQWCWYWAEGMNVMEWESGDTMIYREDLVDVMHDILPVGLPHTNTLLLVLAACRLSPEELKKKEEFILEKLRYWGEDGPATDFERNKLSVAADAFKFLKYITQLPEAYRTGKARAHLLKSLPGLFAYKPDEASAIYAEFQSGRADERILGYDDVTLTGMKNTFIRLAEQSKHINSPMHLAALLDTGLQHLPEPAEEINPEPVKDLLGDLQNEQETEGLANLTKAILSVFRIPPLSVSNDDQQLGGVSDISNRGPLHRLLLSELANDDDMLMARLAQNEAMYLRRESPPNTPERRRTLLLDISLPLWGKPRVFGVAAALACAQQNKNIRSTEALAIGGSSHWPVALHTKEGVRTALTRLQPDLHSGNALLQLLQKTSKADEEIIFITAESLLHDPDFLARLLPVQEKLSYLISVNRQGNFRLYRCSALGREELMAAQFDLDKLLFPAPKTKPGIVSALPYSRKKKRRDNEYPIYDLHIPAFFNHHPSPLFFPSKGCRIKAPNYFFIEKFGLLIINDNRRLLYFSTDETANQAAREILPCLPELSERYNHHYIWHVDENGFMVFAFHDKDTETLAVYLIRLNEHEHTSFRIPEFYNKQVWIARQGIVCYSYPEVAVFDLHSGQTNRGKYDSMKYDTLAVPQSVIDRRKAKKLINSGYSVFDTNTSFSIGDHGRLFADQKVLVIENEQMYWREARGWDRQQYNQVMLYDKTLISTANMQRFELEALQEYKRADAGIATWADGSVIIQDPRGFLHFISSNPNIPDFTIVSISESATTAWTADNNYAGNDVFIPAEHRKHKITVNAFASTYLMPFLQTIRRQ